jgi:hypothetical protein
MNSAQPLPNDASDGSAGVRPLLAAVRRRLWLERLLAALRGALWSWAAILAIAAALHLASGSPGLAAACAVATVAVLAALGRAALQRPGEAESALYADRRLGGESAYSTWLEARADAGRAHDAPALRRLAQWTAAAAPRSRSALAAMPLPLKLARPLAAAAICTVVAALVTALPASERRAFAEPSRQVREPSQPAEPLSLDDDALALDLAAELSTTRDTPDGSGDAGRGSMRRTRDGEGATSAAAGQDAAQTAAPRDDARRATDAEASVAATDVEAASGPPRAADEADADATASARGSGREAGTSRDERAAATGSRALQGALAVQRRDVIPPGDDSSRQADMGQAGFYGEDAASNGGAAAPLFEAAAARPPIARHAIALTPAEASFARTWAETARAQGEQPR